MDVRIIESKIEPDAVGDVVALAEKTADALNAAQPEGVRWASLLLGDGETLIALLQVDEGVENPLAGMPEYREMLGRVEASRAAPADVRALSVVGAYRVF
jgi:hypothetical protein